MGEEACGLRLNVPVGSEVLDESLVGEKARLGEAVHTLGDLKKGGAIGDEWCKVVALDGGRWEETRRDAHVLWTQERRS